jgi:hypothetical protein
MICETVGANASKKDKESIKRFLSKSKTETAPTISTIKERFAASFKNENDIDDEIGENNSFIYSDFRGNGSDSNHFQMFVGNKRLFKHVFEISSRSEIMLHIDGTYKTNNLGYYLIPCGVSDRVGQFHPLFYGIISHQQADVLCK